MPRRHLALPLAAKLLAALLLLGLGGCKKDSSVQLTAILPMTGEWSHYGELIRSGIDIGLEECKADPASPPLELRFHDSQSEPETARQILEDEYKQGTWAAIGGVTTREARAMITAANEYDRILLSPWAPTSNLTESSQGFYRIWPADSREGMKLSQYAYRKLKAKKIVTLTADDDYALGVQEDFASAFEQNGGEIVEAFTYPSGRELSDEDVNSLISEVLKLRPQAIYLADQAQRLEAPIERLRRRGFRGHILLSSSYASTESLATVGKRRQKIHLAYPPYDTNEPKSERLAKFVETYEAAHDAKPDIFTAHGYDAMLVFCQALQNGSDSPANFWKGLRALQDLDGASGILQFDEKGDVQKWPHVYRLIRGKPVAQDI